MTTMNANRMELNSNVLNMVNGGFYFSDTLKDERYTQVGIRAERHWFKKNEYWLPDGTKTDMSGADAYVKSVVGEKTFNEWVDETCYCEDFDDDL